MKKRMMLLLLAFSMIGMLTACSNRETPSSAPPTSKETAVAKDEPITREIFAMDTYMSLTAYGDRAEEAVDAAAAEIRRLDALLSVGDEKSLVYQLNHGSQINRSEDIISLTETSKWLYEETAGAYDISIYPLMQLWGFTGDHPRVPTEKQLQATLAVCGLEKLELQDGLPHPQNGQGIDFGGIAKGYTSQRIMEIFAQYNIESGVVSLGGNVECFRTRPDGSLWRCGITDPEHPQDQTSLMGVVRVSDCAVITSGGYERFFEENDKTYHHIMDPKTGYPADSGLKSVTIVSRDGTLADGLSTACFVMGKDKAVSFWKNHHKLFDMILITEDDQLLITSGIKDSFTSEHTYEVIE